MKTTCARVKIKEGDFSVEVIRRNLAGKPCFVGIYLREMRYSKN